MDPNYVILNSNNKMKSESLYLTEPNLNKINPFMSRNHQFWPNLANFGVFVFNLLFKGGIRIRIRIQSPRSWIKGYRSEILKFQFEGLDPQLIISNPEHWLDIEQNSVQGSNSKLVEAAKPTTFGSEPTKPQTASQDRYSALKELDELFKSTTINSKLLSWTSSSGKTIRN